LKIFQQFSYSYDTLIDHGVSDVYETRDVGAHHPVTGWPYSAAVLASPDLVQTSSVSRVIEKLPPRAMDPSIAMFGGAEPPLPGRVFY
jgi:hypothetical protein